MIQVHHPTGEFVINLSAGFASVLRYKTQAHKGVGKRDYIF